ncbi:MAG: hypothetical protein AB1448_06040 [Pseudomonadota bacterium]
MRKKINRTAFSKSRSRLEASPGHAMSQGGRHVDALEALVILWLFLLIVLGLTVADQGPVGIALRQWLVEAPARRLSRLTAGQAAGLCLVVVLGVVAIVLFEADGARMFALAAPDMIAWALMFDVTVIFDLVVIAISLRAVAGWRGLMRQRELVLSVVSTVLGRIRRRARSRGGRFGKPRPPRSPSDDAEPEPGFAFA